MSPQASPWIVIKLGGTSVAAAAHWDRVAAELERCQARGERVLVVHSALAGVTDLLQALLEATADAARAALLRDLQARHALLAEQLGVDAGAALAERQARVERLVTGAALTGEVSARVRAEVLAHGELMASELAGRRLAAAGLAIATLDARELLASVPARNQTERAGFLNAECEPAADAALAARLDAGPRHALTQGFIARNANGETVVLGRGGSDTSAAYLAAKLGAKRLEIWTDVAGMYTADPRSVSGTRLLKRLDYDEAQEIATTGAKVLHPRCLDPVRRSGIPLAIRCTADPDAAHTEIGPQTAGDDAVKAISVRRGVTLVTMDTVGMWQQVGFLADAFAVFKRHGLSVDLVSTSETCVTASLDEQANAISAPTLAALLRDLAPICQARAIPGCAAVSVVGRRMRANLHRFAPALELFEEQEVFLVGQAANDLNFTFVVEDEAATRVARELHALLVPQGEDDATFGPRWDAQQGKPAAAAPWWRAARPRLLELAERGTPVYAYSAAAVRQAVAELRTLGAIDRLLYAVKANPHAGILELLHGLGVGFECVSPGELARVREACPGIAADQLLFTPNFAPRAELREAAATGVTVTLDNLHALERWGEDHAGTGVFLRVDPGTGAGHHRHVRTAGQHSKFGIPREALARAATLARTHRVRVIGLHFHLGSGIVDSEHWREAAAALVASTELFPDLRTLDLGGGLGIPDRPGAPALDLARFGAVLAEVKAARPALALWLEPGRFLVARAGVLLARVTQLKGKGGSMYVGCDAGMNSLIRPALYGAHHPIVNLTRLDAPDQITADVVGPICESGDVLGHARRLPETQEGDVLLIADAGAYGAAMASRYNLREPAGEVLLA